MLMRSVGIYFHQIYADPYLKYSVQYSIQRENQQRENHGCWRSLNTT